MKHIYASFEFFAKNIIMNAASFEYFIFQGTFSVYEKLRNVDEFISECLEHPLPFVLHDGAAGGQILEDKDSQLIEAGLVPTALLNFAWHPEVAEEVRQQLGSQAAFLKDHILALAKSDWEITQPFQIEWQNATPNGIGG